MVLVVYLVKKYGQVVVFSPLIKFTEQMARYSYIGARCSIWEYSMGWIVG